MNKNYQMSDLMKAAIVNSILTAILFNVSITFQTNRSKAEFDKQMERNARQQQELDEGFKQEVKARGFVPKKGEVQHFKRPEGPQPFLP